MITLKYTTQEPPPPNNNDDGDTGTETQKITAEVSHNKNLHFSYTGMDNFFSHFSAVIPKGIHPAGILFTEFVACGGMKISTALGKMID